MRPLTFLYGIALGGAVAALPLPLGAQAPEREQASAPPASVIHWWQAAVVFGGVTLASAFDENVEQAAQRSRSASGDDVASVARRMGQPEVFVTVPAMLVAAGIIGHQPALRHAAARVAASLAVAGVLVTATKFVVGRERPSPGAEQYVLKPLSGTDAFPSGHTTMAFALATSLADEVRRPWATVGLMVAATATGWSRINDEKHWLSDVVAGAALGISSAQMLEHRWRLRAAPIPRGIAFRVSF